MTRVFVICEGRAELLFIERFLASNVVTQRLIPILTRTSSGKTFEGHGASYERLQNAIMRILTQDPRARCTTFFDYFGLHRTFPRPSRAGSPSPAECARQIESALEKEIAFQLGDRHDPNRFKAYISMHEFEALLFSDPERLAEGLQRPDLADRLAKIRATYPSPEHINDGQDTAPSKRLQKLIPGYDKPVGGTLAALSVGLPAMLRECPHFAQWVEWLRTR